MQGHGVEVVGLFTMFAHNQDSLSGFLLLQLNINNTLVVWSSSAGAFALSELPAAQKWPDCTCTHACFSSSKPVESSYTKVPLVVSVVAAAVCVYASFPNALQQFAC